MSFKCIIPVRRTVCPIPKKSHSSITMRLSNFREPNRPKWKRIYWIRYLGRSDFDYSSWVLIGRLPVQTNSRFDEQVNWIESATIDNVLCRSTKTHSCVIELDRCFSDHHLYYSIDDLVDKVSEAIQAMYGMTVSLRQNERTFHTYETALHTMLQLSPTVMTGRNAIIAILIRTSRLFIKKHDPPNIDRS